MSAPNATTLAEQYVLVAASEDNSLLEPVAAVLPDPAMFEKPFHQDVYRTMQELRAEGQAFNLLTVAHRLKRLMADTLALGETLPRGIAVLHNPEIVLAHARIVAEGYVRREVERANRQGEDPTALLDRVGQLYRRGQDRVFDAQELALLAFTEAHTEQQRLPFPFAELQRATSGGMRQDELVIVAGRPGTGKTAWLLQYAWHLADLGKRVLFITAEMSAASLTTRIASHLAGRNLYAPRTDAEREALNEALERISKTHLKALEITEVEAIARHLQEGHAYDVVFVDYLQQLHTRSAGKGEFELVTAITRQLDALSMKYHLPFVVASQFSRAAEGQQPGMASLKSSGMIEQAADIIISLWSKPGEQTDPSRAKVYMDILKNRNGYTAINGTREYALWFNKPTFTFHEIEQRRVAPSPYRD